MKDKFDLRKSYTFSHVDWEPEDFFSFSKYSEIENDICRLRTLSIYEHRKLARKIYSKIRLYLSSVKDQREKEELKNLARLISMKVKKI